MANSDIHLQGIHIIPQSLFSCLCHLISGQVWKEILYLAPSLGELAKAEKNPHCVFLIVFLCLSSESVQIRNILWLLWWKVANSHWHQYICVVPRMSLKRGIKAVSWRRGLGLSLSPSGSLKRGRCWITSKLESQDWSNNGWVFLWFVSPGLGLANKYLKKKKKKSEAFSWIFS